MNMKDVEEDRAMREIKNSLKDIENFKESNYKQMFKVREEHREEVKAMMKRANVSMLTAKELLDEE